MTVNSPALPRVQPPVEKEKSNSVLSASQLKRKARKGARVFLAVIRPVESDHEPPVVASVAALALVPTSVVQPDQPTGPPCSEVPWVSNLLSEFSEVFQDPLPAGLALERSVQGTVFLQSQVILLRFGRCTVYLRWNTESWKSRSPSF
jgi:hypothetical protein